MTIESVSAIGYLYCLSNPAMPGLVKIGYTKRQTSIRVQELSFGSASTSATGVPFPFEIVKDWRVPADKALEVEQLVHKRLNAHRVASHGKCRPKEFFHLSPSKAIEGVETALRELDWWGVANAHHTQFDREIRARTARETTARRAEELQSEWRRDVQVEVIKSQARHHSATTERLKRDGALIGLKWAAIWFFGSTFVLLGLADAKDEALWFCAIFGAVAYFVTKDSAINEYQGSAQYKTELVTVREQVISASKRSIETKCPNETCKATLEIAIPPGHSVANVRCPACGITFQWKIQDSEI